MTDKEYDEILKHFLSTVRRFDPEGYERLMERTSSESNRSQGILLAYLKSYIYIEVSRSRGAHSKVIHRLNEFIETQDRSPITSVRVLLTPAEAAMYGASEIDLTPQVDNREFVHALKDLHDQLLESTDAQNE